MTPEQEFEYYKHFLTDNGREWIIQKMTIAKKTYGQKWLVEFKRDFPILSDLVDLAANYDQEAAFSELLKIVERKVGSFLTQYVAKPFLEANRAEVYKLHSELKAEIDKPRF